MTSDSIMYRFELRRPREIIIGHSVSCLGETVTYRPGYEFGFAILAERLRASGHPDGSVLITETHHSAGEVLRIELESLYRLADEPKDNAQREALAPEPIKSPTVAAKTPSGLSAAMYEALNRLIIGAGQWADISPRMRGLLKERGFAVEAADKTATITDSAREAHSAGPPVVEAA